MRLFISGDFFQLEPNKVGVEKQLKALIKGCDYNIVNFEGPVVSSEYTEVVNKSGPKLMQSASVADWLKDTGFNVLTLANNHLLDYGVEGYRQTKDVLKNFKLIGCGTWDEAYSLTILEKENIKVGILNFAEMQFGMLYDEWSQPKESIGCAWINYPRVNKLIKESKKQVDYLIVISHAGLELIDVPLPEWRDRYREIIDIGCDMIVGGHPHIPQGYEIYNGNPIFYSLGNFCFSRIENFDSEDWSVGEAVVIDITKAGINFKLIGVQTADDMLTIVDEENWDKKISTLNSYLEEDIYIKRVDEFCLSKLKDYWQLFNMSGLIHIDKELPKSIARILLKRYNQVHLLNNIQCESHRWCISRALRLRNKVQ